MQDEELPRETVIIVLATAVPAAVLGLLVVAWLCCWRVRRRRLRRLFSRGISPIDDEEIESWKTARSIRGDKDLLPGRWPRPMDQRQIQRPMSSSAMSINKAASIVVYQNAHDVPLSPAIAKRSVDLPPASMLARAPNARPGLTDETVMGEAAFISAARPPPCRLAKPPPAHASNMTSKHMRATRASLAPSVCPMVSRQAWHWHQSHSLGHDPRPPRRSADHALGIRRQRGYSTPTRTSFDDDFLLPCVRPSDIGRAIG
ncbi:hypothetical protein CDD81_5459 [Ophiocordyceps australis]|uniref:Uncharacterized protein n=1 Tax=Ophiocordyceps australis TaxID=1399860 RepID=A0A2C5Y985_9HYPO|nr:hypothetical protein CDD81_5459 [Ophiocordyceps australis]